MNMLWIKSKVMPDTRWEVRREIFWLDPINKRGRVLKCNAEIQEVENEFIAYYNPVVYCNDLTGEEWCFDKKLPSGGWLENITPTWGKDGVRVYRATIIC